MPEGTDPTHDHRLPRSVVPRRYAVELDVDPARDEVGVDVVVEVEVRSDTDTVTLHAVDLEVTAAAVAVEGAAGPASVELQPDLERLVLRPERPLVAGDRAELHLSCRGRLGDSLVGLYRSHLDVDGGTVPLAVTQFESTHARRAFPCFDEPDLKAVFAVTVVAPADQLVVANSAEVERSDLGDGRVRVRFADTMPMSTYLVALVVGPLEATPTRHVAGVAGPIPLRVVHPPGQGHLCGFALDVAQAALTCFERYYGLPYPGDKVDLVAVPDFAFGAMENLGCVVFREVLLLVDPGRATRAELQLVADVVNHELAHMWFGDLVTMRWWEGIWLNEAFATFMEVMATDAFRPEWDAWTGFGLARAGAFDTDALASTRPVEFPVGSPEEAEAMFDVLTYEKGASLVRMLEQYLGPEAFRAGIAAYLRRHAYGNTATSDLWDALEEATGEPVRRIMDAWVRTGGHPLVEVTRTPTGARLDQRPMRLDGGPRDGGEQDAAARGPAAPAPPARPVPLVVTTSRNGRRGTSRSLLLEGPVDVALAPGEVLQVNTGADAFVRTSLPPDLRAALALDASTPAVERFMLVDDTWALLLAGELDVGEAVDVLRLVAWRETDPSVWRRLAGAVGELRRLCGPALAPHVAGLTLDLTGPAVQATGRALDLLDASAVPPWQEVRGLLTSLRGTVGGDAAVRAAAPGWLDGDVDADLRAAALDVVAATAGPAEHEDLVGRWRSADTPQEQQRYLRSLADTEDPDRFDVAVDLALHEVRSQDAPYLLRRALGHHLHGGRAWHAVTEAWDLATTRFPSSSLPRLLEGLRAVTDPGLAASARGFLDRHPLPGAELTVAQHLERMDVTVAAAGRVRAADRTGSGPPWP